MTKKFKQQWINALRSGDYEQGTGGLCRITEEGAKYCCLGVAFEEANGEDAWTETRSCWLDLGPNIGETAYYNPGITYDNIEVLSRMNDNGSSFLEIADWIEENIYATD